ncbi:penicillin acylase family protein [Myxococcota bacterium]|nr:penicillin acylase family protein [Myxococcota bacterium]
MRPHAPAPTAPPHALPWLVPALLTALALGPPLPGCTGDDPPADDDTADDDTADDDSAPAILSVPQTSGGSLPGLTGEVHVLRTAADVPHIYVEREDDAAFALGFVCARDRFFMMELGRRLALGRVSELLGDAALDADVESRTTGFTRVAQRIHDLADTAGRARFDRYAEGVNAYQDEVRAGRMPVPSELEIAAALVGVDAVLLLTDWTALDVAAMGATAIYEAAFDSADLGQQDVLDRLPTLFDGAALGELREAGAWEDIFEYVVPTYPVASAYSFGLDGAGPHQAALAAGDPGGNRRGVAVEAGALARARGRLDRLTQRLGHDPDGWGSNAWAAGPDLTADGSAIMAADGHLPLSVPSILWQFHLDARVLGGADYAVAGLTIPGIPTVSLGTNGKVAWSQTQFSGDQVDYYREEFVLDAAGLPTATVYQGGEQPVYAVTETYVVADVPALGSEGRTEAFARWETEDGRAIVAIEGDRVDGPDAAVGAGQSVVNVNADWIVPRDVDGDGAITGISFDFNAFDIIDQLGVIHAFGESEDIEQWFDQTRRIVSYSQNLIAIDSGGNILYSGYEAIPCRDTLPRDDDGRFVAGADPRFLLDGTLYPGFQIAVDGGGYVVEDDPDPTRCVVPWDRFPHAINPERGFVVTANNDPGALTFDNDFLNDEYYLGGPWTAGHRAARIEERIQEAAGGIDIDVFSEVQADRKSLLGREFTDTAIAAVDAGRAASELLAGTPDDQRLAALYLADPDALEEARDRLEAWAAAGHSAESGVETFYHQPTAQAVQDAIATAIFNAWWPRFANDVFGDEGLPGVFKPWGLDGRARALLRLIRGSEPGDPEGLASYNPETGESAFFDVLGTDEVERLHEVALGSLVDALAFLEGAPSEPGVGGYGTGDMEQWLWGLRHVVRFESLLADFLGDDPMYAPIVAQFSITPDLLPLMDSLPSGDPRRDVTGFPRGGDNLAVDAANTGTDETTFDYGSGPVMRMVIALQGEDVRIRNVIPGGQSGIVDSPHFADQASLWLANQALDVPWEEADVASQAQGHEVWTP